MKETDANGNLLSVSVDGQVRMSADYNARNQVTSQTDVKRGDNLFRIRAGTSPIGILPNLDAERIHFEVRVGDIIIMMSDGVTPTPDVPAWLLSALNGDLSGDLSLSAERLVELAQKENSAADDTSICLIKITPPKKGI